MKYGWKNSNLTTVQRQHTITMHSNALEWKMIWYGMEWHGMNCIEPIEIHKIHRCIMVLYILIARQIRFVHKYGVLKFGFDVPFCSISCKFDLIKLLFGLLNVCRIYKRNN